MPRIRPLALTCIRRLRQQKHASFQNASSTLPIVLAANESVIQALHAQLPWWASIMGFTCLLRSCLTLPIAIYQQKSVGKMIQLAPMIQSWGSTLRTQIASESKQKGWGYTKYNVQLQKQYRKKVSEIYAHYGCPRWKLLALPYVQIPLWVSMSLTLRHMSGYPLPWYGQTSDGPVQGLSEGGFAWVTDLTVPDPTMTFPLLIGAGTLLNVELNAWLSKDKEKTTTQKVMTNAFRCLAIVFVPVAAHAPMSLGLYWFTSTWYSAIQNVAFQIPSVRTTLNLPPLQAPPSPSKNKDQEKVESNIEKK
ncbi:60Kd inner membrane protein-domain-containing protein [Phascolomyces articulosus]|uniref:60Kd inner membrane protein-domain-containing protein n=1 Tax=Phascolomyces articulosus TaxID=60185 RepID=A0AAD5PGF1_9FUNG|nr:60Kd inner membrane protein-domain-containing protein [Phascolomyces articulosus]